MLAVMGQAKLCHGIKMTNNVRIKVSSTISDLLGGGKGRFIDNQYSLHFTLRQIRDGKLNNTVTMGHLLKQPLPELVESDQVQKTLGGT